MKKPKSKLLAHQNNWGWVFILPFVVGVVLIFAEVLINSLQFSFCDIDMTTDGYTLTGVGFAHYRYILRTDPKFLPALWSSAQIFVTTIPVTIIFSMFVALMLNQKMHGRTVFRAIFFVPVILATGVVAQAEVGNSMLSQMESMSGAATGIDGTGSALQASNIAAALSSLHLDAGIITFIEDTVSNIYSIVNQSGVQIILFLAGLQSISPSIYEAASIEGCSGWESFWKITFPMLGPITLVNCVYSAVDIFTNSTNPIMQMITDSVGSSYDYGTASAMAWMYFLLILAVLGLIGLFGGRLVAKTHG